MIRLRYLSLLLALSVGATASAEGPKPFPEFEAKRVKPPQKGERPSLIQIDPAAQTAALASIPSASASVSSGAQTGRYTWFWEKVSPEAGQSGPGRLQEAMATLSASNAKVAAPRLQQMQNIARAHGIPILRATIGTEVSPALVLAVILVESSGNTEAVSTAGAEGLMQLMPATAARFDVADRLAPEENITGGVKYLDWLMQEFDRDPILVLAGYNAGEGSVRKHAGVPPFAETRDYVPKVLAAFQVAKGLCKTPPELISDGCVFHTMN